jgi:hypothetical protein
MIICIDHGRHSTLSKECSLTLLSSVQETMRGFSMVVTELLLFSSWCIAAPFLSHSSSGIVYYRSHKAWISPSYAPSVSSLWILLFLILSNTPFPLPSNAVLLHAPPETTLELYLILLSLHLYLTFNNSFCCFTSDIHDKTLRLYFQSDFTSNDTLMFIHLPHFS